MSSETCGPGFLTKSLRGTLLNVFRELALPQEGMVYTVKTLKGNFWSLRSGNDGENTSHMGTAFILEHGLRASPFTLELRLKRAHVRITPEDIPESPRRPVTT